MNVSKALISQNTYLLELRKVGAPVGDYNDISEEWLFLGTETLAISNHHDPLARTSFAASIPELFG